MSHIWFKNEYLHIYLRGTIDPIDKSNRFNASLAKAALVLKGAKVL